MDYDARREFLRNLKGVLGSFRRSLVRSGRPTSDRARGQRIVQNFFLHVHPARIHEHSLKWSTTLGLGIATTALFVILTVTGVLLMVYYKPSVASAYDSIKDIHYVVPTGRVMRNAHRWAAQGMVVTVILHLARVFYTAAYKPPREFNWLLGLALFVLTLGLSFTGYLLPWDQLAFWAVTIGSSVAGSPRELTDVLGLTQHFDAGGLLREGLLGAHFIGEEALIRFYTLHVMVLPIALTTVLGVHFWRIRKDGGLARPACAEPPPVAPPPAGSDDDPEPAFRLMAVVPERSPATDDDVEGTVPAWPHVLHVEAAVTMLVLLAVVAVSLVLDAPLKGLADPDLPENPAKAPWYFLGLQELVSYSGFMGGVVIPGLVVLGLASIPYLDREREEAGVWFSGPRGARVAGASAIFGALTCAGVLAVTVRFGWLRTWFPSVPQLVVMLVNPGTVYVLLCAGWSFWLLRRTNSTRMAAIGLFTCFLVDFIILTWFATVHRGPNWEFYWHQSDWPVIDH